MTGNDLRKLLHSNKKVYGTLVTSYSPHFFDATINLGMDFVFIDMEHISINTENISWMCRAFKAAGVVPIVRILSPDPYLASKAIDLGASGILAPYVEQIEDVNNLIGSVKYKPLKGEKLKNIISGKSSINPNLKEKLDEINRDHLLFINIESPLGVSNLDSFLSLSGLDGVIIGPHDLSISHEIPEEYRSDEYLHLVTSIIQKTISNGLSVGCHSGFSHSLDLQSIWLQIGANIILHGADVIFYQEKASQDFASLKALAGDIEIKQKKSIII